jgi:hypothetical protein
MREIKYLSPTGIQTFRRDPEDYYIRYLSEERSPRPPQTKPMSIGSAFDAYIKSFIFEKLFGKNHPLYEQFELTKLFETQVEECNRDWAWKHGQYVFDVYCKSGALADMMTDLNEAIDEPRFELEVKGLIYGVPLLGKPDVFFTNKQGYPVILDWKVNGYCSNSAVSPMKGYLKLVSLTNTKSWHREAIPMMYQGMMINTAHYLEDLNEDWANQLAIYGWLCGEEVGNEFIVGLDQIVCKPTGGQPELRIAEHRCRISKKYQEELMKATVEIWETINSRHIFRNMSPEDSMRRCLALDALSKANREGVEGDSEEDKIFREMVR